MKYSVSFNVYTSYEIGVVDVYDEEEAMDEVREELDFIEYGKMEVIDDFSSDIQGILYNELMYDEEDGSGCGYHEVSGCIDIEVEAASAEDALEKAKEKYNEITSDETLKRDMFGDKVFDVSLQVEPSIENVLEVKDKERTRTER